MATWILTDRTGGVFDEHHGTRKSAEAYARELNWIHWECQPVRAIMSVADWNSSPSGIEYRQYCRAFDAGTVDALGRPVAANAA